ncbi:MAG: A/G-specific adenine glycosylase [Betaproteobacteria bacterium RIFCSPLOWO2_02_FULL_62_17]|nr:MAG: A/G-specific adenine glycosylase [Betaproteobacteria bacterium RIFCSPLOWO2_02_FULL_62_17]
MRNPKAAGFARRLIRWQRRHGRLDLPWQNTRDPYRIWLSEVMLQQTQVATVIPYYGRFLERFPDVDSLAQAGLDDVLALWSGLGYYSRARNLHLAAQQLMARGGFPEARAELEQLRGIGRSTAAAIAVFSAGRREAILDGNVKRVLARHFAIEGFPGERAVGQGLWALAESLLPASGIETYTQALMDLGATVCLRSRPLCAQCAVKASCMAREADRVADYPRKRARKPLPHRKTVMPILLRGGKVLLVRRPASGIWGGLLCLPEFPNLPAALREIPLRFGCELESHRMLAPLEHGFTHFSLTIRAALCQVRSLHPRAAQAGEIWMPLARSLAAPIPAPVRTLLLGLRE